MFLVLGLFGSLPLHFLFFFPFFPLFLCLIQRKTWRWPIATLDPKKGPKRGKRSKKDLHRSLLLELTPRPFQQSSGKREKKERKGIIQKKEGEQTTRVDIIVSSTKKMLKICVSFIIQLNLKASYCLMIVLLDTADLSSML